MNERKLARLEGTKLVNSITEFDIPHVLAQTPPSSADNLYANFDGFRIRH